jgi:MtN3 and saliva related transmembrane protein
MVVKWVDDVADVFMKNLGLISVVGFLAGVLTTAANVPQVWKTYRDRSAEGLSFRMLLGLDVGLALWMVYGFLMNSLPLILTNPIGTVLISSLIVMKWKFDRSPTKD